MNTTPKSTDEIVLEDEDPMPSRSFSNNSPHRSSLNGKKGKISDYLCGLTKKKSKDGLTNGSVSNKMSKSQFYYSPTSSTPSPKSMSPEPTTMEEHDQIPDTDGPELKVSSIENKVDLDDGPCNQNSVQFRLAPGTQSIVQSDTEELTGWDLNMEKESTFNSLTAVSPFYTLTVHIVKGSNLVVRDKNGSSDPYVKVKLGDRNVYKTKVIYANLNPVWDEAFTISLQHIEDPLVFKVVDYDWGSKDDFMGMCITNLKKVAPNGKEEDFTLSLSEKGVTGSKSMGELSVSLTVTPRTPDEQPFLRAESIRKVAKPSSNGVLAVLLIGLQDLPVRRHSTVDTAATTVAMGYANVFAKLRLGIQKRRSKHLPELTTRPEFLEQFDFYLADPGHGQSTIFEMDFFEDASTGRIPLGSTAWDIGQITEKDSTREYFLGFSNGLGTARVAMTMTAFKPELTTLPLQKAVLGKYSLRNTLNLHDIRDVGHLRVKVIQAEGLRAADLSGKSDPFCLLELVNARAQTHTEYKTLNPTWNKSFDFEVHDITSILEVTVYDEDRDHRRDFLGKINIPLWKVFNGEAIWYRLKNRKLAKGARGNNPQILLQMTLTWNPIRAAIRVTDPQAKKYTQPKPQLKIETFLVNMERLRLVLMDLYDIWLYIKSCLDWEYPERSLKALTFYLLTCYFFQPYFIPLYCLVYWLRPWWRKLVAPRRSVTDPVSGGCTSREESSLTLEESDDEEDEGVRRMSLVEKFTVLQDASGVLQELVGEVAAICESTINTYEMVVPFIYWLFALAFATATGLLFFVDFRYVAMLFGLHEFSRVYLRPWKRSTFECYHMIRRVPHKMNIGDKLGINSVLKSIQQLKNPATKDKFWKRSRTPTSTPSPSGHSETSTSWYVKPDK